MKEQMKIGELAEYTGFSRSTIRRAVERNELHAYRTPGGHSRFWHEDVSKWLHELGYHRLAEGDV